MVAIPLVGTSDFQGMGRYLIGCFPVFAAAGDWLAEAHRARAAIVIVAASAIGLEPEVEDSGACHRESDRGQRGGFQYYSRRH